MKLVSIGTAIAILAVALAASAQQPSPTAQTGTLRIVVLEGEDAVNIIQQKTAVRPVVEVRDSNDLPVAGVAVRFAIQSGAGGGSASFGTQSVATVTTNAAGRAVAPQMQAIRNGAFRINVQASYQGRVATTSISQTNYLRAADVQAARSGRFGGPGSSSTSGVLSNAGAVAGIGAAAVGGALAVKQGTDSNCDSTKNKALDDLELARAACSPQTASCQATAQRAASSLGDWCSCGNRADVDTTVRGAQGSGLADLAQAGVLVGVALPASCQ